MDPDPDPGGPKTYGTGNTGSMYFITMYMIVDKPAQILRLASASHLVRALTPYLEHEFKFPMQRELSAQTKKWKDPWGQVFLQW